MPPRDSRLTTNCASYFWIRNFGELTVFNIVYSQQLLHVFQSQGTKRTQIAPAAQLANVSKNLTGWSVG